CRGVVDRQGRRNNVAAEAWRGMPPRPGLISIDSPTTEPCQLAGGVLVVVRRPLHRLIRPARLHVSLDAGKVLAFEESGEERDLGLAGLFFFSLFFCHQKSPSKMNPQNTTGHHIRFWPNFAILGRCSKAFPAIPVGLPRS